jgi:flagellar basal-body rod modification protein FlgD
MQFNGISAIGKIADTGSNAVALDKNSNVDFQLYFPDSISTGEIKIMDVNGSTLQTIKVGATDAGVAKYTWDGTASNGERLKEGTYYIEASYAGENGLTGATRVGRYPIESIKFDGGKTLAKLGATYVDFSTIKEVLAK